VASPPGRDRHRHLAHVGLDLREVGVDGGVQPQILRDAPAQVPADFGCGAVQIVGRARLSDDLGGEFRVEVHHQTALQTGESHEPPRLDQEARAGAHRRRPGVFVPGMLGDAHHLERPTLWVGALVAQALERNPDLDFEAPGGDAALGFVDEIGVDVHNAVEPPRADSRAARGAGVLSLAADAVLLYAERVHGEQQRAAVVGVGVEQQLDLIVALDVVAVGQGGAHHRAVRLERPDAEVDRVGRVPDQHLGRILGGAAVGGKVLRESGEPRRLAPDRLVQLAIHPDGRLDAWDGDVELAGAATIDGGGCRYCLKYQQQGEHG